MVKRNQFLVVINTVVKINFAEITFIRKKLAEMLLRIILEFRCYACLNIFIMFPSLERIPFKPNEICVATGLSVNGRLFIAPREHLDSLVRTKALNYIGKLLHNSKNFTLLMYRCVTH